MLAVRNRGAGMFDADGRIAGRLHHHLDIAGNRLGAVGGEGRRCDPVVVPADGAAGLACALRIEIDDDGHFQPRCVRHLRQEHRAEFAGADQRDAHGFAGSVACDEEGGEVHGRVQVDFGVPAAVQRAVCSRESRDPSGARIG